MSYEQFYETWNNQLRHLVTQLTQATRPPITDSDNHALRQLTDKTLSHYTALYHARSQAASENGMGIITSKLITGLERSLHWVWGWRPTTAFHVIYTESSISFESHVEDILQGLRRGDLGDLSPEQFRNVSELQCETVAEENAITDELAEWQNGVTDCLGMYFDIDAKLEQLVRVLNKADDLRLRTIQKVVDLLTPQQAVEFLIATAELQFGIHTWGLNHDRERKNL